MSHRSISRLGLALLAVLASVPGAPAQETGRSPFNLSASRDFAVTGMRTAASARFWISNAGPMDAQSGIEVVSPAQVLKSNVFNSFLSELALWASAGRTDYLANKSRVPSLASVRNAATGGHTISVNNHLTATATDWLPIDGSLGIHFSGIRSSTSGCISHTKDQIPAGFTLMPGSDCLETWGASGFQGRRNVPQSTYQSLFQQLGNAFTFDFWKVPEDPTESLLGNNFQTYGLVSDFNLTNNEAYGSVIPGRTGSPATDGYPLGLEWRFDAFNFKDARYANVVFWQATVTNRSRENYGVGMDYDSLYAGFVIRPTTAMARGGYWPEQGAVVFNDLRSRSDCDQARALPERLIITNFNGSCSSIDVSRGFTRGAMAVVMLKSPIGDLRNKLFTAPLSPFLRPTHPLAGDTLTYNVGRDCGQECSSVRMIAGRGQSAWGVVSSHEGDALAGDQAASLTPNDYWFLFHSANGAAYNDGPRVDIDNPRAGGGFNYCVPGPGAVGGRTWTYRSGRPSAAGVGPDTLFLDDCNPTTNQLVGFWRDTFPDKSLKLIRGSLYLGAGPFRLAAGETTAFVVAVVLATDSASIERSVRETVELYRSFYSVPQPPPLPKVITARVTGGDIRSTFVRVTLDPTLMRWTDEFLLFESQRYRNAPATTTEGRIRRFNPWLPDSLLKRATDNIARILVYKSCNPTATTLTYTTTNTLGVACTVAEMRDTLNRVLGPVSYAQILRPDTVVIYDDGAVNPGQSYLYAFVPETRGAKWSIVDSTATGFVSKELVFETPVHELPRARSADNVVTVYIPASRQAGGTGSDIVFREEKLGVTIDTLQAPGRPTVIASWNGFGIEAMDPTADANLRVIFADRILIDEYRATGAVALDSVRVRVARALTSGFTITGSGLTAKATPVRQATDTLVYRAGPEGVPFRSITTPATTVVTAGGITTTTRTIVGPAAILVNDATELPLFVSNNMRGVTFTPQEYLGHANAVRVRVTVDTTAISNTTNKGFQSSSTFDPRGVRVFSGFQPLSLSWTLSATASGSSRPTGAGLGGEYAIEIVDQEFGSIPTFRLDWGAALADSVARSLANRAVGTTGATDSATAAAVAKFLNRPNIRADSLLAVKVPFTVTNRSFGTSVAVAMLKTDKDTTYVFGTGSDTIRVRVPQDQWLPGDLLMFIEEVPVGAATERVVTLYPAVLSCGTAVPGVTGRFRCNPVSGTGGDPTYGATPAGYELRVRYTIPPRPPREVAFTVIPAKAGSSITSITKAQMDSVNVVPNPYIIFSSFEQQAGNKRLMFTHLPPGGKIQIFTVAGQFVQELTWAETDLEGAGDLFFDMRTREGTEMAAGLYLYVVTARDPGSGRELRKLGRFIIIR
ncbi:MAG: hypothetical protein HY561_12705 [Gemmatimonadetes bacterium]|nr:hypothetical protein [Gemmatimonadota bacterium]